METGQMSINWLTENVEIYKVKYYLATNRNEALVML